jgi:hypothetical protein
MKPALDPTALDQLFREAHTFNKFSDQPWGSRPSANCTNC